MCVCVPPLKKKEKENSFFSSPEVVKKKNKTKNMKTCIDSLESTFMAVMNSRSAVLKGQKKAITAERPSRL